MFLGQTDTHTDSRSHKNFFLYIYIFPIKRNALENKFSIATMFFPTTDRDTDRQTLNRQWSQKASFVLPMKVDMRNK